MRRALAVIICGLLSASFAVTAWVAVRGKGYTPDEPGHALVGWFMLFQGDYRFWDNNPPLWEYWIALPGTRDAIGFDPHSSDYLNVAPTPPKPVWSHRVPLWLMERGRMMCLVLGVGLAILIGQWAWELGGALAAIAATFLYCLDPNFIGHAALLKNDVGCALFYLATAYASWKAGQRLTIWRAMAVAILAAVTVLVKFSGPLLAPVLVVMFGYRAISSGGWAILGRVVTRRIGKLAAAVSVCLMTLIVAWAMIWASYGYRFDAGPNGLGLSTKPLIDWMRDYSLKRRYGPVVTGEERAAWEPPAMTRVLLWAERKHLIPEAFAVGIIYTEHFNQGQEDAYLMGESYHGGRPFYFPLAFLFKEPLATIAAESVALVMGIRLLVRRQLPGAEERWVWISLMVPAAVYAVTAVTSEMNIGYRHVFPVLPFVFIAVGVAAGEVWKTARGRLVVILLGTVLVAETIAAFPDYIAFFNVACASNRAWFLGDSNLDWGQDLPALAAWQREHPGVSVYLDFFGHDIPEAYGVHAIEVGNNNTPLTAALPAVVAVSVSKLQYSEYDLPELDGLGIDLHGRPDAILGGSIYVFGVHLAKH